MKINQSVKDERRLTVALEGRLDSDTAPQLQETLDSALEGVTILELDFEKLEYVSSAGLRLILSTQKRMDAQGGEMKIKYVSQGIKEILDITGFTGILKFE
jgi:anti-sigma B factor antagonist